MPYLAYERTVGNKVIAMIWMDALVSGLGAMRSNVKLIPITEIESKMSIDELKAKYPYETYNYSTETARSAQTDSKIKIKAIAESEDILRSSGYRADTDTSSGVG